MKKIFDMNVVVDPSVTGIVFYNVDKGTTWLIDSIIIEGNKIMNHDFYRDTYKKVKKDDLVEEIANIAVIADERADEVSCLKRELKELKKQLGDRQETINNLRVNFARVEGYAEALVQERNSMLTDTKSVQKGEKCTHEVGHNRLRVPGQQHSFQSVFTVEPYFSGLK